MILISVMDKVLLAVVVRSDSQRLANKWALPIDGIPALGLLIARYRFCRDSSNPVLWLSFKHELFICTSERDDDDMIAAYASYLGIDCFRGDADSVALRLTALAEERGYDYIMRLTGDNPLVDFDLVGQLIEFNQGLKFDYSRVGGIPVGVSGEIFSVSLLRRIVLATAESPAASEYLTFFVSQNSSSVVTTELTKQSFAEIESTYNFGMDNKSDYIFLLKLASFVNPICCDVADLVETVSLLVEDGLQLPKSSSRSIESLSFDFGLDDFRCS